MVHDATVFTKVEMDLLVHRVQHALGFVADILVWALVRDLDNDRRSKDLSFGAVSV